MFAARILRAAAPVLLCASVAAAVLLFPCAAGAEGTGRNPCSTGSTGIPACASADAPPTVLIPEIDEGFRLMYQLKFSEARARITDWGKTNAEQPLFHAALAATYLFEEFYHQGVFTSAFFLDDKKLLEGIEGRPDEERRKAFLGAIRHAQDLAERRRKADSSDTDALFVLAISNGMLADYTSLIERRQFASLKFIKAAEEYSKLLLAASPHMEDAYVALGAANYIIGCLPGYKQFFLRFGGIRGDRMRGMMQLEMAVRSGNYLKPFAKILLALVALREKQPGLARRLLEELVTEFPTNPVFRDELAKLKAPSAGS